MRFTRLAPLALLVTAVSGGCRAGGGLSNFNSPSPSLAARPAQKASELLAEHNRNAERIKSFESKTSITVRSGLFGGALDGGIVMERPRNFSLVLKSNAMGADIADIGSNDDEYWFWVRANDDKSKKAVYYCKHEDASTSEMAATLQPNWIIESLGLRVFPEEEMAEMTVKPGKQAGTVQITHHASTTSGISYTREIVLSESTRRIKELRILGEKMNLLAEAQILDDPTQLPSGPDASSSEEMIYVPSHLKLKWTEGNLALDVRMKAPKVNFKMDDDRRQALFVEPERKGYERFNLATLADRSRGTTVRQTRPAPAPRVKLGEPTPVGADNTRRTRNDPVALSADLAAPLSTAEEVVDAQLPSAPEPEFMKATGRAGWRSSRIPAVVRE